jgi:hypothetical protein
MPVPLRSIFRPIRKPARIVVISEIPDVFCVRVCQKNFPIAVTSAFHQICRFVSIPNNFEK